MKPRDYQKTKSRFGAWTLSAAAIAGMMAPPAIVAPARAAVLHGWNFDPVTEALTVTLPDGITPKFFLLAEPARIVLEIPNTTLGTLTTAQEYSGAVRSIRLMEVAAGSRLVIELAPNTRLDPRHAELTAIALDNGQTQWSLQPLLQDSPPEPVAAAPPITDTDVASPSAAAPPPTANPPAPTTPPTDTPEENLPASDDLAAAPAEFATDGSASPDETAAATTDSVSDAASEAAAATVPLVETPPELPAPAPLAEGPSLPEIANTAAVGAVRSLPTVPEPPLSEADDSRAAVDLEVDESIPTAETAVPITVTPETELPEVPAAAAAAEPPLPETDDSSAALDLAADESVPTAETAVPIAVTPETELPGVPADADAAAPSLPDIANEVTAGAVRSLPTGPDPLAGVNTEASALTGVSGENLDALPPGEIPSAQVVTSSASQAAVSVPSLAEADSTPAPAVSVPELATGPDADVAIAPPANAAGIPTNQVRPPNSADAPVAPPVVTEPPQAATPPAAAVPAPETVTPPIPLPPAATAPDAIAAAPIEVPSLPGPPESWSDPTAIANEAGQSGPPPATAVAPDSEYITQSPPQGTETAAAPASEYITQSPPGVAAVEPATTYITESPPTAAASTTADATEYITERPPTAIASAPASAYITEPPPTATSTAAATEYITQSPPSPAAPTTAVIAAPPTADAAATEGATVPPPPRELAAAPTTDAPPFLPAPEGSAADRPSEQPTIPPPPAIGGPDTVPFGAPLPQTKSLNETEQSALQGYNSLLPVGTPLSLQYVGAAPLELSADEPVDQVLSLTQDVTDPDTGALLLSAGTQVWGRFEGTSDRDRRFVAESVVYGRDRFPLLAESDWLAADRQPQGDDIAIGSSIGAAAVTVLSGFTGLGLVGGAAVGALTSFAQSPAIVTIEPGAIIEVETVSQVSSAKAVLETSQLPHR